MVTFGDERSGGDSTGVDFNGPNDDLLVEEIIPSGLGFSATRSDGSVISWGYGYQIGSVSVPVDLVDFDGVDDDSSVVSIFSGGYGRDSAAFAAQLSDGSMVTWGRLNYWGDEPVIVYQEQRFSYQVSVSDPDILDSHVLSLNSDADWLSVNPNTLVITGVPSQDDVGSYEVELTVTDSLVVYQQPRSLM